jgi:hypothetical protein
MQHKNLSPQDSHSPSQERVENLSGSTIAALRCVRYTGITNVYPSITLADATSDVRGITQAAISDESTGYILCYGFFYNLDTSAWAPGTSLFAAADGSLTDVSGGGPQVANVLKQHASAGVIQVTCLDTPAALTVSVQDSDSVDLDTVGSVISADVILSPAAASDGHLKATTTVKAGGQKGLHVEVPFADGSTDGVLKAVDWAAFSGRVQQSDARLSVLNVFRVKKNPGTGEYPSISAAVAAADSATPGPGSPYMVWVAPGVYVEPLIEVPSYVYVVGQSMESVQVQPSGDHDQFKLGEDAGIMHLSIRNTGTGRAAIRAEDTGFNCIVHKVDIQNCDIGVHFTTTPAATGIHYLYLEYASFENCLTNAVKVTSQGSAVSSFSAENFYAFAISGDGKMPVAVHYDGANVQAVITGTIIERDNGVEGIGVLADNGATFEIHSLNFSELETAIEVRDGAVAKITGVSFDDCDTNIRVTDAESSGYYEGYSEYAKLDIHSDSDFFITNKDANIVTVSKKGGDFTSLKDAIAAITDASASKPYVIEMGPGVFPEDPITLKPYVIVEGIDDSATILQANDPTQPLITGVDNSEIKYLQLVGPTDSGVALVAHTGTMPTQASFGVIDCAFADASRIFSIAGDDTNPTVTRIEGCRITSSSATVESILEVDGTAAGEMYTLVKDFNYRRLEAPYAPHLFDIYGPQARVLLNDVLLETDANDTHGVHIEDGASVTILSSVLTGLDTAVHVHNVGAPARLETTNLVVRNSNVDIHVEHPGTTGGISAQADSSKVLIDANAPITVTLTTDNADGGLFASGPLRIGRKFNYATNVLDLLEGGPAMGVMNGGELSDGGGFVVNVEAGFGYVQVQEFPDHRIIRHEWADSTITLGANQDVYVYFNSSGVLTSAASITNSSQVILLGRVVTNSSGIELIEATPFNSHHPANRIDQMFRDALGPIYDSGSIVTENATPFKLNVTAGVYFFSAIRLTPSGGNAISFTQYRRNGSGGFVRTTTDLVNHTQYDDGTGTLAPLTAGYYTKHTLYVVGQGSQEKYFLVLGQAEYSALAAAESAALAAPPSWLRDGVTTVAGIVVQQGAANITEFIDLRPRIGFRSSGVSASSDHGNLLGLADDDHQQYLLANGGRAMSGDLDMGGNAITNVGTVDGVDISEHASRHLPNGADPLATAAPLAAVSATTSNATGTQNSLARSDHQHSVATGAPSTQTADQSNATGSSPNLARADHVHNIPTAAAVGLSASTPNAQGTEGTFAKSDHTHSIATGAASTQIPDQANAAGSSANIARADHVHNVPTDAPITIDADGNNTQGNAASFARSNHKHNVATAAPVTQNVDQANAAGTSTSLARADHIHNVPTAAPSVTLTPSSANAQGAATSFARSNHTHAIATALAASITTVTPNAAAAAGTAENYARGDHVHAIATASPATTLAPSVANAEGTGNSFARSSHTHSIATALAASISTVTPNAAGAAGSADNYARGDHVHAIATAAATTISTTTTNAEGTGNSFARASHTHAVVINDTELAESADVTTTSTTDTLLAGMSATPAAGKWLLVFSCEGVNSGNGAQRNFYSVYVNGVQVATTERALGVAGGGWGNIAINTAVTVNGSQAVEIRWRVAAGTGTTGSRNLNLVKLSN